MVTSWLFFIWLVGRLIGLFVGYLGLASEVFFWLIVGLLAGCLVGLLVGMQDGWSVGRLAGWLVGRLAGWVIVMIGLLVGKTLIPFAVMEDRVQC
jgi:hypothetical protein